MFPLTISLQESEAAFTKGREDSKQELQNAIDNEKLEQWRTEGQMMLIEAKKENVLLQLEATYRERLAIAYREVSDNVSFFR